VPDGIARRHRAPMHSRLIARVRIHVKSGKIAAGNVHSNPVTYLENMRSGAQTSMRPFSIKNRLVCGAIRQLQ